MLLALALVNAMAGAGVAVLEPVTPADPAHRVEEVAALRDNVAAALRAANPGSDVVSGTDALLSRAAPTPAPNARAAQLLREGEELMLSFEHARAAATLAECAALLEARLSAADLDTWSRARTLEGVSWHEAGNAPAARDAFLKLLARRTDVDPDPALLSPAARAVFEDALREVRARGAGAVEVRSSPLGALVVVDGQQRGRTPVTVSGLTAGGHILRLGAPGFDEERADLEIRAGEVAVHESALRPSRARVLVEDAVRDDTGPVNLGPLAQLAGDAGLDDVVLLAVREHRGERYAVARRAARPDAAAWVPLHPSATVGARLLKALDGAGDAAGDAALDVDFGASVFGEPRTQTPAAPPPPPDDAGWLVWGAAAGGALLVTGAVAASAVLLWPRAPPERRLGVIVELPSP